MHFREIEIHTLPRTRATLSYSFLQIVLMCVVYLLPHSVQVNNVKFNILIYIIFHYL